MSEQPSCYISESEFIEVIGLMQEQYLRDIRLSGVLNEFFSGAESVVYNNVGLAKACMMMLRRFFPPNNEGFCEIEHYCYVMNFGKCGDVYESPEELYNRLMMVCTEMSLRKYMELTAASLPQV